MWRRVRGARGVPTRARGRRPLRHGHGPGAPPGPRLGGTAAQGRRGLGVLAAPRRVRAGVVAALTGRAAEEVAARRREPRGPTEGPLQEADYMVAYFVEEAYPILYAASERLPGDVYEITFRNSATETTYRVSRRELDEFEAIFAERNARRNVRSLVRLSVLPRYERHMEGSRRPGLAERYLSAFHVSGVEFIEWAFCAIEYLLRVDDWTRLSSLEKFMVYVVVTQADNVDRHAARNDLVVEDSPPLDVWNLPDTVRRLQHARAEGQPLISVASAAEVPVVPAVPAVR